LGLQDNSPTNQLVVSQVTDWSDGGLVNFINSQKDNYICKLSLNLTLTLAL